MSGSTPGSTRIAVTGLGAIAPHGDDVDTLFAAIMRGTSALASVFPDRLPKPAVAATVSFDETAWFTKLQLPGVDRVSQLAVAAAGKALADAGGIEGIDLARVGVYVGCGMGGAAALENAYVGNRDGARVPPLTIPAFMPNAPAAHVALRNRIVGPVLTYSVACASSAVALAEAASAIARGDIDVAIAGGSEALIVPGVVVAWQAMMTLATVEAGHESEAVKPFATKRSGFALGEGAAFMILESETRARARGAKPYAVLAGWGMSCDATHLTKPDAIGQARALRAALARADLEPRDIGYCNAHGTATRIGDVVERNALADVWGDDLDRLRVSSTKALHGHLLGASGALEALITVLALHEGRLPPNTHCDEVDPECRMNLVLERDAVDGSLRAAISNSFAFGGTNSVLVFTKS